MEPNGRGIFLRDAKSAADIDNAIYMWRAVGARFFKVTGTVPAQPVRDVSEQQVSAYITMYSNSGNSRALAD